MLSVNKKRIIFLGLIVIILLVTSLFCLTGTKKEKTKDQSVESITTEKEIESDTDSSTEDSEVTERLDKIRQTGKTTLVVENVQVQEKDSIKVRVWIVNNPGIVGMTSLLSYDQNVLSLKSAKCDPKFQDILTFNYSKDSADGCVFLWTGETLREDQIFDGVLMTMEFEIKNNEKNIKTPIRLIPENNGTYDKDLNEVKVMTDNGYVTIIHK